MNQIFGASVGDLNASQSHSSFGPARFFLGVSEREGLRALYAFCRSVDDAADELPHQQGMRVLKEWKKVLAVISKKQSTPLPPVAQELAWFCKKFKVPAKLLGELIAGAESDMRHQVRFNTQAALDLYCHQVAGVVGQACLPLFGLTIEQGKDFAEALGLALQQINFIRDAAQDAENGRIYFSLPQIKKHKVNEKNWFAGNPGVGGQAMLLTAVQKADMQLEKAWRLRGKLQGQLKAADVMADVYGDLLRQMRLDGCRVFKKRYRISKVRKIFLFVRRGWRDGR